MDKKQVQMRSAFIPVKEKHGGLKGFDKDYVDVTVKEVAVKTGEGEEEFSIIKKSVVSKRNIKAFINSQAQDVGIEAYKRNLALSGQPLTAPTIHDGVNDFTKAPQSLADLQHLSENANKVFNSMDSDLKGNNKSIGDFLAYVANNKQFIDEYIAKKTKKTEVKPKEGE